MSEENPTPLPVLAEPVPNPDPDAIPVEKWVAGEDPILEVLNCVYPTLDSEERRKDVIEYMQKLIRSLAGVEVFPYGSVPLKTYLPDGDIDLTAIGSPKKSDTLPRDVFNLLQYEAENGNNEYDIREITFVDAEVKIIKCIVSDIVMDISFNQLGGLCTLCFIEKIDRHIGNDHIFKRSIILIKTWCYYESRILGAVYGLLSTYALEVLVLYIFHVFGASITSPLMALYRFLDYYDKFDWDNYCISLNGPFDKASKSFIVVENTINRENGAVINEDFLKHCLETFMVPCKDAPTFLWKSLNIIDPLLETNNLGRSVHTANSYRIRSAFKYGARTLGEVLELPNENIAHGIRMFFATTLQRHQWKYIPEVSITFDTLSLSSISEGGYEDDVESKLSDYARDDYIPEIDDDSIVGSIDETDLSAFENLSLGTTDDVSDVLSLDSKIPDVTDAFNDTESLSPFADLTGDYESSLRSLLFGQTYHGYALTGALVEVVPVHGGPYVVPSGWFYQSPPRARVMGPHEPYFPGEVVNQAGQRVRLEESHIGHGTGTYIPVMVQVLPQRVVRGPPSPNRPPVRAPEGPGPSRMVHPQRKLQFGAFGPMLVTGSSSGSGSGSTSASQGSPSNLVACGLSQGSVQVEKVFLKNEEDFPPLAA